MKKIYKIAKLELSLLFYSPVAWLILIVFLVQCGMIFTGLLDAKETSQLLGGNLKNLTVDIFGGNHGFFTAIQNKLYLYIPLLTMGLMSRELSSGSIKLLFSSPITSQQIVLGKFLSMMCYGMILVSVLFLVVLAGSISIEALDIKFLMGGILGLYILICAYASIGLFMSSITPYQVVAAIGTLAILAAFNFVGKIGQSIDIVRDVTYWISISGRADNFINGLISSKDVIYFLLVIFLFLALTIMRLDKGRKNTSTSVTTTKYSILVIMVLLLGYISSIPAMDTYYDTTRFKKMTLTNKSIELIKKLEKPVTITTYVNIVNSFAHLGSPKWRIFDMGKFNQYTRFLPDMKMKYVMYYDSTFSKRDQRYKSLDEMARRAATAYGIDFEKVLKPEEIRKKITLSTEENMFVRKVEYNGQTTSLRMFFDLLTYPGEAEISAALKRLITTPPTVGILLGNGERGISKSGDRDYKNLTYNLTSRSALINQGFNIVEIANDSEYSIPDSLTVLVVADPIIPYSENQRENLINYIAQGGNVLIAGEPNKADLLNSILDTLGVSYIQGTLLEESKDLELDVLKTRIDPKAKELGFNLKYDTIVSHPGAMGIQLDKPTKFTITPLSISNKNKVWNKEGAFNLETDSIYFNPEIDRKIETPVTLAMTRKIKGKDQKILIAGDADFMSNGELGRFNLRTGNHEFSTQIFKWFANNEFPIDTTRPEPIDNLITIGQKELSWIKIIFSGVLPLFVGIAGISTLINRKRK